MPCDTVQLNELLMQGMSLDTVEKTLKALGVSNVYIDRVAKIVKGDGVRYDQRTGALQIQARSSNALGRMDANKAEVAFKREYISQTIRERATQMGWSFGRNSKGKLTVRKRTGSGSTSKADTAKSDNTGAFQGFSWGKQ